MLNDSAPLLKMLCQWLEQHGHHCNTALLADMPQAQEEVGRFIQKHRPDVVIYDVGLPYSQQLGPVGGDPNVAALQSQPFVITTPNKRKLEQAVGPRPPSRSEVAIPICVEFSKQSKQRQTVSR